MTKIVVNGEFEHSKASERYVSVVFVYDDGTSWEGWIPIQYRRTGTELTTSEEISRHLRASAVYCHPRMWSAWRLEQQKFWKTKPRADVTKPIYDVLESFEWTCTGCSFPSNTNPARRYQDLKEFGYTLATDINRTCPKCGRKGTHILLIPLPRGGISGYETWTPSVRGRIVAVHESVDVYEAKQANSASLIPDHKFPEIRWDVSTRRSTLDQLSQAEILHDFQLFSNQRNLQKREVCRICYQTGKRGYPFGIAFYYQGNENWPPEMPRKGKDAECGCVGCGWYDLAAWRTALNLHLARD